MTRFAQARKTDLPVPLQLAIADDENLDDDTYEDMVATFGGPEPRKSGWGMSEVLGELLSTQPKAVKVKDLQALQNNLKAQGYLPQSHPADGTWDPASASAFRRLDRDAEEKVREGKHWLAAPVSAGLRAVSYVLPSNVLQGIVGAAKGIVEQTGETAERVGAAGGAVAGAAIGTAIAPGVGTAIGAGVGAVAGFAADFFGDDDPESEGANAFIDALSPFEEYKAQGAKAFFEDLGFVLSAASIIKGATAAAGAATTGAAGIGAATSHGVPLSTALLAKQGVAQPGVMARIMGAGIGKASSSAGKTFVDLAKNHGLLAQTSRPLLRTANETFTGLAAGQFGARLAGGLGSGEEDTAIERNIREAPKGPEWVDNTIGWFVYSNKFLPIKPGGIRQGAGRVVSQPLKEMFTIHGARAAKDYAESALIKKAYVHVAQRKGMSLTDARRAVDEMVGTNEEFIATDFYLRIDRGLKRKAGETINEIGYVGDEVDFDKVWRESVFDEWRKLNDEWDKGESKLTEEILRYTVDDPLNTSNGPMDLAAHLEGLDGVGAPLERLRNLKEAHRLIEEMDAGWGGVDVDDVQLLPFREPDATGKMLGHGPSFRLELQGMLPETEDALYHVTPASNLAEIKKQGLRPGKTRVGEPTGVYFGSDGVDIVSLIPNRHVRDSMALRVKRSRLKNLKKTDMYENPSEGIGGGEYVSLDAVPASDIEVLTKRGWVSLGGRVRDGLDGYSETPFKANVSSLEVRRARAERKRLSDAAGKLLKRAQKASDPQEAVRLKAEADALKARAKTIKATRGPKVKRDKPYTLTVMRNYDPATNTPGGLTEQDLLALADDYDRRAGELRLLFKNADDDVAAFQGAQEGFNDYVDELALRGAIHDKDVARAKVADPANLSDKMRKRAAFHAKDVADIPDDIAQRFKGMGYKIVATAEDVPTFPKIREMSNALKLNGVGDYTKRQAFFDTIGLSPFRHADRTLSALRNGHDTSELHQVLAEEGIKLSGKQAMRRILNHLEEFNHGKGVIVGPGKVVSDLHKLKGFRFELYKVDPREFGPDDIAEALKLDGFSHIDDPHGVAMKAYDALKRGAAMGGETNWRHPLDAARQLGKAMRVSGAPGFSDFMRTWHIDKPVVALGVGGAVAGGAAGFEAEGLGGAIKGAAWGGVGGVTMAALLKKRFPKGTYGYLPDHMHRLNMALRYSLSFTFDAGRYTEQNMLGFTKADLPPIFAPKHYIQRRFGEGAWGEAMDLWDEINGFKKGKGMLRVVDDTDRRMFQRGMLAFSPRYHEAAQMFLLHKRGWNKSQIEQTVSEIGRYGTGRTAAEKSANFFFFPFSFQKKLVGSLANFVTAAPARALLIHEGLRRFEASSGDERFAQLVERHLPLLDQLKRVNNLAYGISPGRFFLEGLADNKTDLGKVTQILSSTFIPSGAATPIAQMAGGMGDLAVNMFVPVGVTGEDMPGMIDLLNRYIPAVRDFNNYWEAAGEQKVALQEGTAPYIQFQEYLDEKRLNKAELEPFATALGYSSVDGFLSSNVGLAFKAQLDQQEFELGQKYPTGFKMAQEFTNTAELNKQALYDLASKEDRSDPEDAILKLAQIEQTAKLIGGAANLPADVSTSLASSQMRKFALERATDTRFVSLWDRFFLSTYGPISRVAA